MLVTAYLVGCCRSLERMYSLSIRQATPDLVFSLMLLEMLPYLVAADPILWSVVVSLSTLLLDCCDGAMALAHQLDVLSLELQLELLLANRQC